MLFLLFLAFSVSSAAPVQFGHRNGAQDPEEVKRQQEMQKNLAKQRSKEIKQDTDKLLGLANELKKSVDEAQDGDKLSLEVIRKTEDVEKLAKKIRDKMKETYILPEPMRLPDASTKH